MSAAGVASLRRQHADISRLRLSMPSLIVEVDAPAESATGEGNRWDGSLQFSVGGWPGPRGTPYEGGRYRFSVLLPAEYPLKSPSAWWAPACAALASAEARVRVGVRLPTAASPPAFARAQASALRRKFCTPTSTCRVAPSAWTCSTRPGRRCSTS